MYSNVRISVTYSIKTSPTTLRPGGVSSTKQPDIAEDAALPKQAAGKVLSMHAPAYDPRFCGVHARAVKSTESSSRARTSH